MSLPDPRFREASIGRIVLYRSKRNPYDVPAVITATQDSLWRPGVEAGEVPDLASPQHVHLHVFTPGRLSGYQEFNVPLDVGAEEEPAPRTWRWPVMRGV